MAARVPPVIVEATAPPADPAQRAGVVFMHGLGDDGAGVADIAAQFQGAGKLPHVTWIFPTALENRDAMATAWYQPTPLPSVPSQRPELDDPEDEAGFRSSTAYIEGLVGDELEAKRGIPLSRVVLAGFSQGCAMSLFMAQLSGRCAGRVAGVAGLGGYMPLAAQMRELRAPLGEPVRVRVFLARGGADAHVPRRFHEQAVKTLREMGVVEGEGGELEERVYPGMGHAIGGAMLRDLCAWLEKVVPPS